MSIPSPTILPLSRLGIGTTLVFALSAVPSGAEKTRTWEQQTFQDFEKGKAEKVTIRSDGKLFLAPRFRELLETPSSYLWDLVRDGQGNLFASGGPDAAVLRIGVDGESTAFFKVEDAEIHALAVDREDNVYAATSPDPKVYRISPSGESSVLFEPDANYVWDQCCPGKVAPTDGKSLLLNVLWSVLPGNDLKSRGRKWPPERSIPTRHNGG